MHELQDMGVQPVHVRKHQAVGCALIDDKPAVRDELGRSFPVNSIGMDWSRSPTGWTENRPRTHDECNRSASARSILHRTLEAITQLLFEQRGESQGRVVFHAGAYDLQSDRHSVAVQVDGNRGRR